MVIYIHTGILKKQNLFKSWTIELLRVFHVLNTSIVLVTIWNGYNIPHLTDFFYSVFYTIALLLTVLWQAKKASIEMTKLLFSSLHSFLTWGILIMWIVYFFWLLGESWEIPYKRRRRTSHFLSLTQPIVLVICKDRHCWENHWYFWLCHLWS